MRNTIRNVTMVVPVLMTSCQLFEYSNTGPNASQTTTVATARLKALVLPVHCVAVAENRSRSGTMDFWRFPMDRIIA